MADSRACGNGVLRCAFDARGDGVVAALDLAVRRLITTTNYRTHVQLWGHKAKGGDKPNTEDVRVGWTCRLSPQTTPPDAQQNDA